MDNILSLDRFHEALDRKGWTIKRLAEEYDEKYFNEDSNTNAKSIYKTLLKWNSESANPTMKLFVRVCDLLECDVDYLLGRMDTHTHTNAFIQEQTGLSENAVEKILSFNKESTLTPILDFLLCSREFESILTSLYNSAKNSFSYLTSILKVCFSLNKSPNARPATDTTFVTSSFKTESLPQKPSNVEKPLNKEWEQITDNICNVANLKAIESFGLSSDLKDIGNSSLGKAKSMRQDPDTSKGRDLTHDR